MSLLAGLRSMINDGVDNSVSSRRVVTIGASILVALAYLLNLFCGMTVAQHMYDSMMMIVVAGMGTTVVEKFAPAAKKKGE